MTSALAFVLLLGFVASVAYRLQLNHVRTCAEPRSPAGAALGADRDLARVQHDLAVATPPVRVRVRTPRSATRPLVRTDVVCPCP